MLPRALRVTRAKDPRKTALHQERVRAKLGAAAGASPSARPGKYRRKFTAEEQTNAGRAAKLLGRSAAFTGRAGARGAPAPPGGPGIKTPEQIVFEGKRVSSKDGRPRDLKFGKKAAAKGGKPKNRGTKRAAEWRKKDKA